jgi:hypothetical protein
MQVPLACKRYPVAHERHVEVLAERHEAQLAVELQPVVRTAAEQSAGVAVVSVYPVEQLVQERVVPERVHAVHPGIPVIPEAPREQETQALLLTTKPALQALQAVEVHVMQLVGHAVHEVVP